MAGSKEIRNKIKSVQNTRKITKAMEMVAASKMKKAQDRMRASRPYVDRALQIAMHVAKANTEYKHPFLARRETVKRVGAIVVTTGLLIWKDQYLVDKAYEAGDRLHITHTSHQKRLFTIKMPFGLSGISLMMGL